MDDQDKKPFDVAKVQEKLKNVKTLSDLTGQGGVIQEMIKSTVERILKAEQEAHLGYEPHRKQDETQDNSRNGYSRKTVKTTAGSRSFSSPATNE